jgi:CRP-like cAMP-binding protein
VDIGLYVKNLEPVMYPAGEVLFRRGDPGGMMYVVKEGEVELTYGPGRSVRVGPGHSFGEMSIIDKSPRSADGVAVTDVELYPISQGLFLILVQETPYFALDVMKSLSERLRNANASEGTSQ